MCMGRVERVIDRLPLAEPKNRCKNSNSNKYNPIPNYTKANAAGCWVKWARLRGAYDVRREEGCGASAEAEVQGA